MPDSNVLKTQHSTCHLTHGRTTVLGETERHNTICYCPHLELSLSPHAHTHSHTHLPTHTHTPPTTHTQQHKNTCQPTTHVLMFMHTLTCAYPPTQSSLISHCD